MVEYYFDMETTGVDFNKAEISTIQWQRLDGFTGEPIDKLNILKSWESSEKEILESFLPNLTCRPFDFIFVGKNLLFDFCLLNERLKKHRLGEFDFRWLYERCSLDLKHILILMNKGNFSGYDKVLPKTNPLSNDKIPELIRNRKYTEVEKYIEDEASDFVRAYQVLKKEMPLLVKHF
jgi:hypothetical protein